MNAIVPSGTPVSFEYSASDNQNSHSIAFKIYDITSGTASLVTTIGMIHVFNGTYFGNYTFSQAQSEKVFLIQKSVFTDGTFATADTNYAPGSEIVQVDGFDQDFGRAS